MKYNPLIVLFLQDLKLWILKGMDYSHPAFGCKVALCQSFDNWLEELTPQDPNPYAGTPEWHMNATRALTKLFKLRYGEEVFPFNECGDDFWLEETNGLMYENIHRLAFIDYFSNPNNWRNL